MIQPFIQGVISRGIDAIIKIGSVLPILLLKNFGCSKNEQIDKPSNSSAFEPLKREPRRECIKPPEIRDLQHTGELYLLLI